MKSSILTHTHELIYLTLKTNTNHGGYYSLYFTDVEIEEQRD